MATVLIDTTGWTQNEKNSVVGVSNMILHNNSITYDGKIVFSDPNLDVPNPSGDITSILTTANLKTEIEAVVALREKKRQEAIAESNERKAELSINEFANCKLSEIEGKIDSIQNLNHVKIALKKIARFCVARWAR